MKDKVLIAVPPGWTRTDGADEIVLEGPLPDSPKQRNAHMRIVLKTEPVSPSSGYSQYTVFDGVGLKYRGGSMHLRREVLEHRWDSAKRGWVETGKWRRAGVGGPRLTPTLLWTLAHAGGRW